MEFPRGRVVFDNQLFPIAAKGHCPDTIWWKIRYFGRKACKMLERSNGVSRHNVPDRDRITACADKVTVRREEDMCILLCRNRSELFSGGGNENNHDSAVECRQPTAVSTPRQVGVCLGYAPQQSACGSISDTDIISCTGISQPLTVRAKKHAQAVPVAI